MVQLIKEAQKVDAHRAPLCTLDFITIIITIIIIIINLFIVGRLAQLWWRGYFQGWNFSSKQLPTAPKNLCSLPTQVLVKDLQKQLDNDYVC